MSDPVNKNQSSQKGGDQQPLSKKHKRGSEEMEDDDGMEISAETGKGKEKAKDQKEPPTLSEKHNSDDADISLISSDNILFKVHSYRLMCASSVFRDMLKMPNTATQRDPIYLTDEKLEREVVLSKLLDVVYDMDTSVINFDCAFAVLDLAEKWEFDHVRELIRLALSHYKSKEHMFHRFHISIRLKDPDSMSGFIEREHSTKWTTEPGLGTTSERLSRKRFYQQAHEKPAPGLLDADFAAGGRTFEAGTWSYGDFLLTSPTVLWALLRATHVGTTTPARLDHGKVAKEFERLLTLAYEPKKDDPEEGDSDEDEQ